VILAEGTHQIDPDRREMACVVRMPQTSSCVVADPDEHPDQLTKRRRIHSFAIVHSFVGQQLKPTPQDALIQDVLVQLTDAYSAQHHVATTSIAVAGLADLFARLRPPLGSRFLHVASGNGSTLLATAMLNPQCEILGLEADMTAHTQAVTAVSRLRSDVQRRVHLRWCDPFTLEREWREANIILINCSAFDDAAVIRIADALRRVESRTVVITFSRPLCVGDPAGSPTGFSKISQDWHEEFGERVAMFAYRKLPGWWAERD